MENMIRNGKTAPENRMLGGTCPDCGEILDSASGCVVCRSCGYSPCG